MVQKRRWASRSPPLPRVSRRRSQENLGRPSGRTASPGPHWGGGVRRAPDQGREPQLLGTPLTTWPATRKQMRAARHGPGCGSGLDRATACASLAVAAPRPRPPDLGRWRQQGRSPGHMAEGDAGSDQRQVRPRRGADLQAWLGLVSPPRASSAEGPSAQVRSRSRLCR